MPFEFRARDYRKEEERAAAALPRRTPAADHPLASPPSRPPPLSSSSLLWASAWETVGPSGKANSTDVGKTDIDDPLGLHMSNETHHVNAHHMCNSSPEREPDEAIQPSDKEWAVFKKALMQKFTCSSMVHVPVASDIISRNYKVTHLEELEDPEKAVEDENKFVTQQEYVSRLKELKIEIERAWRNEDRITSLKLSIKVARLLRDTSVFHFYPMLFILVTDVMDMLGDLVWDRIKKKAEYDDNGTLVSTLRDDFVSGDVCSDAKETCYNWFCKIGSIRELLPRIYLELAILRCWRFLQDQPSYYLRRLAMMMRGLADPLASAYCHLYVVHCAETLVPDDKGYLVMAITNISVSLRRIISEKEVTHRNLGEDKRILITLLEPAIQWIMKIILRDERQNIHDILAEFGLGKLTKSNGSIPCFSVILHYLLKELPVKIISINALEILELLEHSIDISFDQHLNYRLLGLKLSERQLPVQFAQSVVNQVFQVISHYNGLNEYLMVLDAYLGIILQCGMDSSLSAVLDCVLKRSRHESLTEAEMDNLLSILVKVIDHFRAPEDVFTLDHFMLLIDLLHGDPRNTVSRHILSKVTRGAPIRDPRTVEFLFEVSRVLHDDIDVSSFKDDHRQAAGLICHFVRMIDFGDERERHLEFLVECRSAFRNIDELKDSFIHSSNLLAMKAVKGVNKYQAFVKACIAFSEVTIPSISASSNRLNLYLETAEVALSGGLVSHVEGLLDSAITCLEDTDVPFDADWMLSSLLKLCSILIIVPGSCGEGASHIVRTILSVVQAKSWVTPIMRVKMLCAIISLTATLSQEELPYRVNNGEIMSNDVLFFGEKLYYQELESTANLALRYLLENMESDNVVQGKLVLDACNCLVISLKASQELSSTCSSIIKLAKVALLSQDKYLQSTNKFLKKCMPDSLLEPFTAVVSEQKGC